MDSFHLKWKSHSLGGAPDVSTIVMLAIKHACCFLLGRDDGVRIIGNSNKLRIHTIRIEESPRGLAGGLNPVIVFEVHTDTQEINTNANLAIPEVPCGRHKDRELDGKVVPNEFRLQLQRKRRQAAGYGRSWVWLASRGFLCAVPLLFRRGSLVLHFGVIFYVVVNVVVVIVVAAITQL
jgi:hypothetical protein